MHSLSSLCVPAVARAFKKFAVRHVLLLTVALLALPFLALGQEATIVGTVTDPGGAVVPNVTVTVIDLDTGHTRTITTNDSGQYVVPNLAIGHYKLRVEASGFKVEERQNVVLNVGDRTRIDFQLAIGTASETISVEANVVAVQADTGEVSSVITGQQIAQLATNGRSIYTFINLTPGASSLQTDFQTPTPVGGNGSVSFNGNRVGHNIYLLDGGEGDDRGGAGSFSIMPSIDALAEFQTLTSNYSADYGLSSGATMTTALKSGSKRLHFSLWEFNRNNALDARNFFNPAPAKVAKLNFNTYGFNVGGPVTLGRLYNPSRKKTFFFYNMEWRSLIQGGLINQKVPVAGTYGGDFSSALPADALDVNKAAIPNSGLHVPCANQLSPAQQALFTGAGLTFSTPDASGSCAVNSKVTAAQNPTFSPFPASAIPGGLLDANAQALLHAGGKYGGIFPAPTSGSNFIGGNNTPTNVREEIVRIDHNFTDKFSVFGHFVAEQISQGYGTTQWSGDNVPSMSDTFGNPSYSGVIHTAYVISPTLVNEAAFNYNGNRINITPNGLFTAPAGFAFNRLFTGPNALTRIPSINLNGSTGSNYTSEWEPWVNKADDYQIRDDISWTKGKHQLKIGGSWALYKKIQDVFTTTQGKFNFNGSFTGNDFADYLLGYAQNYSEDAIHDNGHWNNVSWAAYVQDNWRVNNRLTLNLGLRWDGVPHTYEANHRMSNFYPNLYNPANAAVFAADGTISPLSPGLGTSPNPILAGYQFYENGLGLDGLNGTPKGLVNNHWAAFGPRLGFAYDLNGRGKTVIRGGFGIMYERVQGNDVYNTGGNVPFSANASFTNVLLSNPKTSIATGTTITAPPLPIPVANITGIAANDYNLPQSYQFSVGVQQSLGKSVLSVSYVGSQNRHQNDYRETDIPATSLLPGLVASGSSNAYNADLPFLGYRSLKLAYDEANGHYNSLQTSLRGNFRNDLTYQVGYTLSRAIDPFATGSSGGDLAAVSNPYVGWKYDVGPGSYDRTHVGFANFVYDIPLLRNSQNRLLKTALGGWEVSGIVTMQSGPPIDVRLNGGSVTSVVQNSTNRPDLVGKITYPQSAVPGVAQGIQWINPAAFANPCATCWGTLGHNAIRGPGRDNWNLSLFKSFVFSEERGSRLEFRAESFNTWNHTQFNADTNGGISNNFGAGDFGQLKTAFDPRVFQLGMKFIF
jgi:hypothetical protein